LSTSSFFPAFGHLSHFPQSADLEQSAQSLHAQSLHAQSLHAQSLHVQFLQSGQSHFLPCSPFFALLQQSFTPFLQSPFLQSLQSRQSAHFFPSLQQSWQSLHVQSRQAQSRHFLTLAHLSQGVFAPFAAAGTAGAAVGEAGSAAMTAPARATATSKLMSAGNQFFIEFSLQGLVEKNRSLIARIIKVCKQKGNGSSGSA
jgi:hypothetical protein